MIRRILLITLLLLALAVTIVGLDSISQRHWEDGIWITGLETGPRLRGGMVDGTFHLVLVYPSSPRAANPSSVFGAAELRLGSFYVKTASNGQVDAQGAGMPFWALAPLLAAWPTTALIRGLLRRGREAQRRERGECIHCGYSLQGLREPRCPECGTPFEAGPTKPA